MNHCAESLLEEYRSTGRAVYSYTKKWPLDYTEKAGGRVQSAN